MTCNAVMNKFTLINSKNKYVIIIYSEVYRLFVVSLMITSKDFYELFCKEA